LNREIYCKAVLLPHSSRSSAAFYTDSRRLRCDMGGSAHIDVGMTWFFKKKATDNIGRPSIRINYFGSLKYRYLRF
jgi:hypothetical protein